MAKIVELQANGMALRLEIVNELGWCQMVLVSAENIALGADTFKVIKNRLLDYLMGKKVEERQIYDHESLKLQWVLSLSEKHATIYGTLPSESEAMKVFCVEDGGHFLPEINLKEQDVKKWILSLENCQL